MAEHLGSTSYVYANTKVGEQLIIEREESRAEVGDRPADGRRSRRAQAYLFDAAGARLK